MVVSDWNVEVWTNPAAIAPVCACVRHAVVVIAPCVPPPLSLACLQVKYLNAGLAKYDSMVTVRLYQSMLAIFSVLSGFFYFNEIAQQSPSSLGLFCCGVALVLWGIVVGLFHRASVDACHIPARCIACWHWMRHE